MVKKKEPKKDIGITLIDSIDESTMNNLYNAIVSIIDNAKTTIYSTANSETLKAYWLIGEYIVNKEQSGKEKAEYGKSVLSNLSNRLNLKYNGGYDYSHLRRLRKLYITFPNWDALRPNLSWTHYRTLITVENENARTFYINESIAGRWGTRTLERAILTKLYERTLLVQKNKNDVQDLVQETKTNEGEEDFTPEHFIKDPYNLAFTGIKPSSKHQEKDIEQALMDKLQDFILELGRGFAFVGRQYRIDLDGDNYYVDLVFYNYILKCFLLIDLKTTKLNHQDIGQMDFYVRYFEKEVRQHNDSPTIGLILCADKNNRMVKYTLLEDSKNIFASQYQLYLPSEEQLTKELVNEKQRLEQEKRLEDLEKDK